ncbi:PPK2 family polyphosphate kinase [Woeseia oceani]|uniref:Phosphate--nucleotide phosphotransferase n=1 Tax=Woeseia oceani TaxID=1548547 RepID=A0A193LGQ4_9GAMM|nr:PPK2 family polyphosphate kinase [Woeseia oceani]ANO51643.1 phosphate--nucleotide phosphotransferase [Woeseia oceani]
MFKAVDDRHLVPFDGSFRVAETSTAPEKKQRKQVKKRLKAASEQLDKLQQVLMAGDNHSVLLVFQAMDAAGKDSTIRAVMQGINPAGCQVFSFKKPSSLELDHDFLWRTSTRLPERGRIGIFNRSQYEEVLVVRVHPEYLQYQKLPCATDDPSFWEQRYESIREQEKHLARNGTVILKFWLNVSLEEQRQRFLRRLDNPDKQWKFSAGDIKERAYWPQYMTAYEDALNATSRPWAPWYSIPADDKPYMRAVVAEIIVKSLASIGLEYPEPSDADQETFAAMRAQLAEPDAP